MGRSRGSEDAGKWEGAGDGEDAGKWGGAGDGEDARKWEGAGDRKMQVSGKEQGIGGCR